METAKRLGMGTKFMEGKELMRQDIGKEDLGTQIAEYDGFAGVYPEHKFALVQAMQAKGMLIGMTGQSWKHSLLRPQDQHSTGHVKEASIIRLADEVSTLSICPLRQSANETSSPSLVLDGILPVK